MKVERLFKKWRTEERVRSNKRPLTTGRQHWDGGVAGLWEFRPAVPRNLKMVGLDESNIVCMSTAIDNSVEV